MCFPARGEAGVGVFEERRESSAAFPGHFVGTLSVSAMVVTRGFGFVLEGDARN